MIKARYSVTLSAVFLSAALAVNFFAKPQEPTPKVLTWNCEIPEYKPESIMLTCADGGWLVHTISWTQWGADGAEGTGIFREKLCDPSCAEGDIAQEKVKVKLSDLAERKGEFYLRTLDISTVSGKDFISGRSDGLQWDVMEFAEVMDWE